MLRYLLPMVMGLSVVAAGCKKQEPQKVSVEDVKKKAAEATGTAVDYAKQEKDEYVAQAEKAVDQAKAETDKLKASAKKARAGAKRRLQRRIKTMEARWELAERKLSELKSASGEAWKDLKSGVDKAIEDLKQPSARKAASASSARH